MDSAKGTIERMKRQMTDWERIFSNHIIYRRLLSRMNKEHLTFNSKKSNDPVKTQINDLNKHFTKKHGWMANKHLWMVTRGSTSLGGKFRVNMIRYHYVSIRMGKIY